VTSGEPSDADAGPDGGDDGEESPQGSVPEGGTDTGDDFRPPLDSLEYPLTTNDLRKRYRQYRVDTDSGSQALPELLDPADGETFGSPAEVRERIEQLADRA